MIRKGITFLAAIAMLNLLTSCNQKSSVINQENNTRKETDITVSTTPPTDVVDTIDVLDAINIVDAETGTSTVSQSEKGYHLPVSAQESQEADKDMEEISKMVSKYYLPYCKGHKFDMSIPSDVQSEVVKAIAQKGCIVEGDDTYANLEHYEVFEQFLKDAKQGQSGNVVLYQVYSDGMINRRKYIFDGNNMYELFANTSCQEDGSHHINSMEYTKLKQWEYRDTGWFAYELSMPQYPEVSDIADGCVLIRVKPLKEKYKKASERYVKTLGYQGNNVFCSNWDQDNMDKLDFTGIYEYLYSMEYGKPFTISEDAFGIERKEFEGLIKKYFPTTTEQIRKQTPFDKKHNVYLWQHLGCLSYVPTAFDTSYPEVVDMGENPDKTLTLTVNAVCEMSLCSESAITHKVTIKKNADGSFQYLGNEILNDGIQKVPMYEYRIRK